MLRQAVIVLSLTVLPACGDVIRTMSMRGTDHPTVLVNGKLDGNCDHHRIYSGTGDIEVDNYQQAGNCVSEAEVFARGNAMGFKDAVPIFTDQHGDVVDVPMNIPPDVPLRVFVMAPDLGAMLPADRQREAGDNVTLATQIYDDNRCGLTFSVVGQVFDATSDPFNPSLLTASCLGHEADFDAIATQRTSQGTSTRRM